MAAMSKFRWRQKVASGARSFAFWGTGDFRSLAEQSGIFPTKHLGAKTHSCIYLRLPKAADGFTGVSETIDQRPRAVLEIVQQLCKDAWRHFVALDVAFQIMGNRSVSL